MLRVITGKAKGRKLIVPPKGTRPLTDRIKTSIFDTIKDFIPGAHVLDLFAGSGSFGIEALSRGALEATFVDLGNDAVNCIETNLEKTGFIEQGGIVQMHVNDFLVKTDKEFDLIFSDPPFDDYDLVLDFNAIAKILAKDGLLVYRTMQTNTITDGRMSLEIVYEKVFGKSRVYFLKPKA